MSNIEKYPKCHMRTFLGNCDPIGGFCTSVNAYICEALHKAADRPTGEWIRNDNGTYSCSVCRSWIPEEQHYYARYCLYCGADMRKGGEDDE